MAGAGRSPDTGLTNALGRLRTTDPDWQGRIRALGQIRVRLAGAGCRDGQHAQYLQTNQAKPRDPGRWARRHTLNLTLSGWLRVVLAAWLRG